MRSDDRFWIEKNLPKNKTDNGNKGQEQHSIILKVIVAVATAILGVFGVNAAI